MSLFVFRPVPASGPALSAYPAPPVVDGAAPQCPACHSYTGPLRWLPPHAANLELDGASWPDVGFVPGAAEFLVSPSFLAAYDEARLTGLDDPAPLALRAVKASRGAGPPPAYTIVRPVDAELAVDDIASGIQRSGHRVCPECRLGGILKRAARIVLERSPLGAPDFFRARGLPGLVLLSETAAMIWAEHRFTGAVVPKAEMYGFDFYPSEP